VGPEETGQTLVARDPPEVGAIGVRPIGVWPPLLSGRAGFAEDSGAFADKACYF
jgi:hypothetical protein